MHLVLLGEGVWKVYARCSDAETCDLLNFISDLDDKRSKKVLSDLREFVPHSRREDWIRTEFSKKLNGTNCVLEFRWKTKGGGTPRVYWFFHDNAVIVCSHGVDKKGDTDEADIREAERVHAAYVEAKRTGDLKIMTFDQFIDDSEG
jgi:hypothetical protein